MKTMYEEGIPLPEILSLTVHMQYVLVCVWGGGGGGGVD